MDTSLIMAIVIIVAIGCGAYLFVDSKKAKNQNINEESTQTEDKISNPPALSSSINNSNESNTNSIGTTIAFIGWLVIICGIIAGIHFENVIIGFGGVISGILIIGLGEIIKLLQVIANKIEK